MSKLIEKIWKELRPFTTDKSLMAVCNILEGNPECLLDHFLSPETPLTVEWVAEQSVPESYTYDPLFNNHRWKITDKLFVELCEGDMMWQICFCDLPLDSPQFSGDYEILLDGENLTREQLQLIMKGME